MNKVLIAIASVAVLAALLWAVWSLEAGREPVRTNVLEESREDGVLVLEMKELQGGDYIIYCSEGRFEKPFSELASFTGVTTEPLLAPGGPMVLSWADYEVPEHMQSAYQVLRTFLRQYSPHRVVLVSHSECVYYDSIAAALGEEEVRERQILDLLQAAQAVERWLPGTEVELYFGDKEGEKLTFTRLIR